MGSKVYEIVTQKIMEKLETAIQEGTAAPWHKPWNSNNIPVNHTTLRPYRGVNLLLLDSGEYLTWSQLCDLQKHRPELRLRKGSKAHMVVYFSFQESTKEVTRPDGQTEEKAVRIPFLKYYKVFSVEDVEWLEPRRQQIAYQHDPIEAAETVVQGYLDREPALTLRYTDEDRACYRPLVDEVSVPSMELYPNRAEFYSTLFHELTHSTGHPSRLNRLKAPAFFGDERYSKEELCAELGAAMLCGHCGIDNSEASDNSVAYLQNWLAALKNDTTLVVSAAAKAQLAADYILGLNCEEAH